MSKVIITGTGRAGTSFIVKLLTHLGADTGFTKEHDIFPSLRAGLEHELEWKRARALEKGPRVIKKPRLALYLKDVIEQGLDVDVVIVPVRDIDEVVESRKTSGTNWMGHETKKISMKLLYLAIHACTSTHTPLVLLDFDTLIRDGNYLYDKIGSYFDFDRKEFVEMHQKISKVI